LKNGSRTRRLWNSFYRVCVRLDSTISRIRLNNTQAPDKTGQAAFQPLCIESRPNFWTTGDKSPLLSQLPNRAGHMEDRSQLGNNSGSIKSTGQVPVNASAVLEAAGEQQRGSTTLFDTPFERSWAGGELWG